MTSAIIDEIDYSNKWYVLAAVGSGIFLSQLNSSSVNIALPTLVRDLNSSFQSVQWVVLSYLLTTAVLLLSMGRLGDILGKKPVYVTGFILFTIMSLLCGLAPSLGWLVGFRIVQGIGAAMTQALGLAIATEAFPPQERGAAVGYAGGLVSLGIVAGPTLGGFIIDALSWPWIFFINVPVGIIGLILVWWFIPNSKPESEESFDFWGAGLLLIGLLLVMFAFTQGQSVGFGAARVWLLMGGGVLFLILFVAAEKRVLHPMVDMKLFRNRVFSLSLFSGLAVFMTLGGVLLLLPFYLENMLMYETSQVGLLVGLVPIVLGIAAPIAGSFSDRVGTWPITLTGFAVIVTGYFLMSQLSLETSTVVFILLVIPFALGLGIFQSPNNSAILGSVDRSALGVASGLLGVTRTLGLTVGTAVLGAIWTIRVANANGSLPDGGATFASLEAQAIGLQQTMLIVAIILLVPLALTLFIRGTD